MFVFYARSILIVLATAGVYALNIWVTGWRSAWLVAKERGGVAKSAWQKWVARATLFGLCFVAVWLLLGLSLGQSAVAALLLTMTASFTTWPLRIWAFCVVAGIITAVVLAPSMLTFQLVPLMFMVALMGPAANFWTAGFMRVEGNFDSLKLSLLIWAPVLLLAGFADWLLRADELFVFVKVFQFLRPDHLWVPGDPWTSYVYTYQRFSFGLFTQIAVLLFLGVMTIWSRIQGRPRTMLLPAIGWLLAVVVNFGSALIKGEYRVGGAGIAFGVLSMTFITLYYGLGMSIREILTPRMPLVAVEKPTRQAA